MNTRRKYDRQFKVDAVRLLETSGRTAKAVALDLGIKADMLSRWKRELKEDNLRAFPGQGNPRDEELTRLRKENAEIKLERDILKKALAIFSKSENRNTGS
jgi:transposase-like protein